MKYGIYMIMLFLVCALLTLFIRSVPSMLQQAKEGEQRTREAACQALRVETENRNLGIFPHPAPLIAFLDQEEKAVWLSSFQGKVVLLHFWSTTCPDCMRDLPELKNLAAQLKGRPFALVALSEDNKWEDLKPFFSKESAMQLFLDAQSQAAARYGIEKLPQSFLIDKQGKIRYAITGSRKEWDTETAKACISSLMD